MDSRKDERIELLFTPTLLDKEGRSVARVANLSSQGALLYVRSGSYDVGQPVEGWVQSPPRDGGEEVYLAVRLDPRWVQDDPDTGMSKIGCELRELDDDTSKILNLMIDLTAPKR
jgi:hypothetical protein